MTAAKHEQNISDCKSEWTSCDPLKLSTRELARVSDSCAPEYGFRLLEWAAIVRSLQIDGVQKRSASPWRKTRKNVSDCWSGWSSCDLSKLSPSEVSEQLIEVIFHPLLKLPDRHAIDPGRSSVLLHFQPRIPHHLLGDDMRLAFWHRLTHAIPSLPVDHIHQPGRPRPLAPPPLRYAEASQLLRASPPACPASVLNSLRIRRLEVSLSHRQPRWRPCRGTPSQVPHESPGRAHAAYTPDTTWAVNG